MAEIIQAPADTPRSSAAPSGLARSEDWWAIFIGLGLILLAVAVLAAGGSLKWLAVAPQKWSHWSDIAPQLQSQALRYLGLFGLWAVLLGAGAQALGYRPVRFLPAFALVYTAALLLYVLGQWDQSAHYNLEPPLVALALGLLISNTVGTPRGCGRRCGSSSTSRPGSYCSARACP